MVKKVARPGRKPQASAPQVKAAGTSSALQSPAPRVSRPRTAQHSKGDSIAANQPAGFASHTAPKPSIRSAPDRPLSQPRLTASAASTQQGCPQDTSQGLAANNRPQSQLTPCPNHNEASLAGGQHLLPSTTRGRARRSQPTGHDAPLSEVPSPQLPSEPLSGSGRPKCPEREHARAMFPGTHDATTHEKAAVRIAASLEAAVHVGRSSPSASSQPLQGSGSPSESHGNGNTHAAPNLVSPTLQAPRMQSISPQRRSGRQAQKSCQDLPGPASKSAALAACKEGKSIRVNAPQAEPSSAGQHMPPSHQMADPQSDQQAEAPCATHAIQQIPAAAETLTCDNDQPARHAAEQDPAGRRKSSRAGRGKRKASLCSAAELSDEPMAHESLPDQHAPSPQQEAEEKPPPLQQLRGRLGGRKSAKVSAGAAKEAGGQVPSRSNRLVAGNTAAADECKVDGDESGHREPADAQPAASPKQAQPGSAKRKAGKPSPGADEAVRDQPSRLHHGLAEDNDAADELKSESDGADAAVNVSTPKASKRKRTFKRQPRHCRKCKQMRGAEFYGWRAKICNICKPSNAAETPLPSEAGQEGALNGAAPAELIEESAADDIQQTGQHPRKRCCPALDGPIGCSVPNFISTGISVADFKERSTELWQKLLNQLDPDAQAAEDNDLSVAELEWETFEAYKEKADARDGIVLPSQPAPPERPKPILLTTGGVWDCSAALQPAPADTPAAEPAHPAGAANDAGCISGAQPTQGHQQEAKAPGDMLPEDEIACTSGPEAGTDASGQRTRKLDAEWRALVSQRMENAKPHLASVRRGLARIVSEKADKHGSFRLSRWKQMPGGSCLQPDEAYVDADIPRTHLLHSNRTLLPAAEEDPAPQAEQPEHQGPLPGWESCAGPSVPQDETLLRIEIRHHDRPIKVAQSILVLGTSTLAELRDKICCPAESSMQAVHRWSSPSSFFFIEGTFFNDQRHPEAQDHSAEIIDFCKRQQVTPPVSFLPLTGAQRCKAQGPALEHKSPILPILRPVAENGAQHLPETAHGHCQHGPQGIAEGPSPEGPLQPLPSSTRTQTESDSHPGQAPLADTTACGDDSTVSPPDFNACFDQPLPDAWGTLGRPSAAQSEAHNQYQQDPVNSADTVGGPPPEVPSLSASPKIQSATAATWQPEASPAPAAECAPPATYCPDDWARMLLEPDVDADDDDVAGAMARLAAEPGGFAHSLSAACWAEHDMQQPRLPDADHCQLPDPPAESSAGRTTLASGVMEDTRFQDLDLRAGARAGYIFCHQGGCEHLLVVRDIRRIHPVEMGDPSFLSSYPYCAFQDEPPKQMCDICVKSPGTCVTHDDELAPKDPCIWCQECYAMMHFNDNGRGIRALAAPHRVFPL